MEKTTEKYALVKNDNIKRKEETGKETHQKSESTAVKYTEEKIDKKPQVKAAEDSIEEKTQERKGNASIKHEVKKRRKEDKGYRHKKIKHKMEIFQHNKSSQKKRRHRTREDDSDNEIEEGEIPRRRGNKYRSPSPTDDCCKEDNQKEIKMECNDCLATSIKQELPSMQGMYHCDICNLTLNSHITYQSHVSGKKHKKILDAKNVVQSMTESYSPKKQVTNFCEIFKLYSHPDHSKAGFYCSVCNSHSNSSSMWEAHIIGKRHIANLKRAPGTTPSKSRNVPAPPGTVARLKSRLKYTDEPIVGLDQIREIQRLDIDSVSYTCFLCGGISVSEMDIVDHILSTKHREKYLEKIRYPEYEIHRYCQMSIRCSVMAGLCKKVEAEQGRGEPEIYYAERSLTVSEIKTEPL